MNSQISKLIEQAADYATHKTDYTGVKISDLHFAAGRLITPAGFGDCLLNLEENAWKQMIAKLSPSHFGRGSNRTLPTDYLMTWDEQSRGQILEMHLAKNAQRNPYQKVMIRGYGDSARAILSNGYAIVDNVPLLNRLGELVGDREVHVTQYGNKVTRDGLHLRTVWRTFDGDGNYGAGVYVGNEETGQGKVKVQPLIWRHSCQNSIIIDQSEEGKSTAVNMQHKGAADFILHRIDLAFRHALKIAYESIDTLKTLEQTQLDDFDSFLAGLGTKMKWDHKTMTAVSRGTEGGRSVGALVHGLTYAAHTTGLEAEEQAKMESFAGRILAHPESLFGKVRQFQQAEL